MATRELDALRNENVILRMKLRKHAQDMEQLKGSQKQLFLRLEMHFSRALSRTLGAVRRGHYFRRRRDTRSSNGNRVVTQQRTLHTPRLRSRQIRLRLALLHATLLELLDARQR